MELRHEVNEHARVIQHKFEHSRKALLAVPYHIEKINYAGMISLQLTRQQDPCLEAVCNKTFESQWQLELTCHLNWVWNSEWMPGGHILLLETIASLLFLRGRRLEHVQSKSDKSVSTCIPTQVLVATWRARWWIRKWYSSAVGKKSRVAHQHPPCRHLAGRDSSWFRKPKTGSFSVWVSSEMLVSMEQCVRTW